MASAVASAASAASSIKKAVPPPRPPAPKPAPRPPVPKPAPAPKPAYTFVNAPSKSSASSGQSINSIMAQSDKRFEQRAAAARKQDQQQMAFMRQMAGQKGAAPSGAGAGGGSGAFSKVSGGLSSFKDKAGGFFSGIKDKFASSGSSPAGGSTSGGLGGGGLSGVGNFVKGLNLTGTKAAVVGGVAAGVTLVAITASSVVLFAIIAFIIHVYDVLSGFGMPFSMRLTIGLFLFIYAFLVLRESKEISFDTQRLSVLGAFLAVFLMVPFLINWIGMISPGAEKIATAVFIILPVWVIYSLFVVHSELKIAGFLKFAYVLVVFFILLGQSTSYAQTKYNIQTPGVDTTGAVDMLKASLQRGIASLRAIPGQLSGELSRQRFYAEHGYYEGNTAKGKENSHLELTEPLLPNTLEYSGTEENIQIGAHVNAFNIEKKLSVKFSCSVAEGDCYETCKPSQQQQTKPSAISNEATITEDIWCYIKGPSLTKGSNDVIISASADDFETKAYLNKYFIDKATYDAKLTEYVRENNIKLSSASDISSVVQKLYPSAKDADVSLSEDAPAKLVISTSQIPVIGIRGGENPTELQFTVAFENNAEGHISKISNLELTYPAGFAPEIGEFCPDFTKGEGNKIILKSGKGNQFNLSGLARGEQRAFSACTFKVVDAAKLLDIPSNINERSFEARILYNYIAEKKFSVSYGKKVIPEFDPGETFGNPFNSVSDRISGKFGAAYGSVASFFSGGIAWPTDVKVLSSCYGPRSSTNSMHWGLDIDTVSQNPIYAAGDGEVIDVVTNCVVGAARCGGGYGNRIYIKHSDNVYTRYAHLTSVKVNKGDKVVKGEQIGISGNTGHSFGDHLHFEVRSGDTAVNPLCLYPAMNGQVRLNGNNCQGAAEFTTNCPSGSVATAIAN
ncbi:MAG: peptidoglycan DD-metalloendopeptidase family protein [Nanoarchaeota archaeon]|nr:peptidoglycan DD-metalloendopeptidase family protein [Nanoarchaeota archaeon]